MTRRGFPHLGKMKRAIRAVEAVGERVERVEVRGDNFVVVIAKRDTPPKPADDLVHEDHAA